MLRESIRGFFIFISYYAAAASLLLVIRRLLGLHGELFRKLLHVVCVLSIFPLLYAFPTWYVSAGAALAFAILVYPLIHLLGRFPKMMSIFHERKPGEIRSSLMIVFVMMAVLIAVFWGGMGSEYKYVIVVSILAWGFGDAAAALVGKAYGRHHITFRWVEGTKTYEGSLAMCAVSFAAIFFTLLAYQVAPWYLCLAAGLIIAPLCAFIEVISHGGIDTITVPLSTAFPLYLLMQLFSLIGA